jgi:hypothetical protein
MRIVNACFVALMVGGCGHAASEPVAGGPVLPPPEHVGPPVVELVPPARVAVSSVNLGDWCPELPSQAATQDMSGARLMADVEHGTSNCQITLTVDGTPTTRLRVVSATLLDENGQPLQPLSVASPQIWNGEAYAPWAGQLDADGSANLLYSLSGIDWSRIENSYGRPLRVELVVEIDGAETAVVSPETIREAMIVT